MYKKFFTKSLLITLVLFITCFSVPKETEAFIPVSEVGPNLWQSIMGTISGGVTAGATPVSAVANTSTAVLTGADHLKKFVLDPIAYGIAKMIIKQLTAQTVNWINSGFKGNPAFVTDPNSFFLNVGDQMAAQVLSNTSLSRLCTPFRAQVRLAIAKNYLTEDRIGSCTLGQIADNFDNFTNNFSSGGWDAFFSVTQNSQNNPYGSYMNTKHQLAIDVAAVGVKYQKQLEQGNGFLSFEKCKPGTEQQAVAAVDGNGRLNTTPSLECKTKADWSTVPKSPITGLPVGEPACLEYYPLREEVVDSGLAVGDCKPGDKETVTPGSVINTQLQKVLGSGINQLELANSINQVVSALMTQLFQQVVGGVGKGLRGASQSSSSSNNNSGRSLIQQMAAGSPESAAEETKNASNINTTANNTITNSQGAIEPTINGATDGKPSITLKDAPSPTIPFGTDFIEPGFMAVDSNNVDISSKVQVSAAPEIPNALSPIGQYTITYTVIDGSASASAIRIVNVVPVTP